MVDHNSLREHYVEREETTIYTGRGAKVGGYLVHICVRGDDEGEIGQTRESDSSA